MTWAWALWVIWLAVSLPAAIWTGRRLRRAAYRWTLRRFGIDPEANKQTRDDG